MNRKQFPGVYACMLTNVVRLSVTLLALQAVATAQTVPSSSQVIPVFTDGVGPDGAIHTTALVLQNPDLFYAANCNITFYGTPPVMKTPDGRTIHSYFIQQFLPAGGFNVLTSTAAGTLNTGYVKLECSSPVAAYSTYSVQSNAGDGPPALLSETAMPAAFWATGFQFINDMRQGGRLAVAFANDNSIGTVVQMTVGDLFGRTIFFTSFVVPRYATVARFLDEIAPGLPANHVGPVVFRSTLGVYTTGLRFNGASVTSISPAAQVQ